MRFDLLAADVAAVFIGLMGLYAAALTIAAMPAGGATAWSLPFLLLVPLTFARPVLRGASPRAAFGPAGRAVLLMMLAAWALKAAPLAFWAAAAQVPPLGLGGLVQPLAWALVAAVVLCAIVAFPLSPWADPAPSASHTRRERALRIAAAVSLALLIGLVTPVSAILFGWTAVSEGRQGWVLDVAFLIVPALWLMLVVLTAGRPLPFTREGRMARILIGCLVLPAVAAHLVFAASFWVPPIAGHLLGPAAEAEREYIVAASIRHGWAGVECLQLEATTEGLRNVMTCTAAVPGFVDAAVGDVVMGRGPLTPLGHTIRSFDPAAHLSSR